MLKHGSFASPLSTADNFVACAVNVVPIASDEAEEWFVGLCAVFAPHRTLGTEIAENLDNGRVNSPIQFGWEFCERIVRWKHEGIGQLVVMKDRAASRQTSYSCEFLKCRLQSFVARVLEVAQRNGRLNPSIHPDGFQPVAKSGLKQVLISGHVSRTCSRFGLNTQQY